MTVSDADKVLNTLADLLAAFEVPDVDGLETALQDTDLVYETTYDGAEIDVWIDGGTTFLDIVVVVDAGGFEVRYPTTLREFWDDLEAEVAYAQGVRRQRDLIAFEATPTQRPVDATGSIAKFLGLSESYVARRLGRGWHAVDPDALMTWGNRDPRDHVDRWYCQSAPTPVFVGFGAVTACVRPAKRRRGALGAGPVAQEVALWSRGTVAELDKAVSSARR